MNLKVLNYSRDNARERDVAIALRDSVAYYVEDKEMPLLDALKHLGLTEEDFDKTEDGTRIDVYLLQLSENLRDSLIEEKSNIKRIRRGA